MDWRKEYFQSRQCLQTALPSAAFHFRLLSFGKNTTITSIKHLEFTLSFSSSKNRIYLIRWNDEKRKQDGEDTTGDNLTWRKAENGSVGQINAELVNVTLDDNNRWVI